MANKKRVENAVAMPQVASCISGAQSPPPKVEHAVRPELMHLDLVGQRERELQTIKLLMEIRDLLRDGK